MRAKPTSCALARDILEWHVPEEVLAVLLKDRSTGKNLIWATDGYAALGKGFGANGSAIRQLSTVEIDSNGARHLSSDEIRPAVFMGAAIVATVDGGCIVAIVPRSFCNGTYYKPFRQFMLDRCAIERIHLFESRNTAFKDEAVLQENVIVLLRKNSPQGDVAVSHSTDDSLQNITVQTYPFDAIVSSGDSERYINIPYGDKKIAGSRFDVFHTTIGDLGLHISTGAVVDFRTKDSLRKDFESDCVPLLYPLHFRNNRVCWPVDSKKPNALKLSKETEKMVFPSGYYVAVKRFSAKEESRRIVASLIEPSDFASPKIAFENHLNVFIQDKHGLDKDIAYGMVVWLNTTWIDEKFRLFSGHTQVNATDLRNLSYPSVEQLKSMGRRLGLIKKEWTQEIFDNIAEEVANEN